MRRAGKKRGRHATTGEEEEGHAAMGAKETTRGRQPVQEERREGKGRQKKDLTRGVHKNRYKKPLKEGKRTVLRVEGGFISDFVVGGEKADDGHS